MITINLSSGRNALIDDEDFNLISQYSWYSIKKDARYYAHAWPKNHAREKYGYKVLPMHRLILGLCKGNPLLVDHLNHNGLDNRKSNLRICTASENQRNKFPSRGSSSKFKGVYFKKAYPKYHIHECWGAMITIASMNIKLGNFKTEENAARAYDIAAAKYFKDFALTNKMLGLL